MYSDLRRRFKVGLQLASGKKDIPIAFLWLNIRYELLQVHSLILKAACMNDFALIPLFSVWDIMVAGGST